MKTYLDCIPCFFFFFLEEARMATQDEVKQKKVLVKIAEVIPKFPLNSTPPEMGRIIHRIVRQLTESTDPYKEIKKHHNKTALKLYPELKERIAKAKDPLLLAIKVATAGNIIDLGANSNINIEDEIEKIFHQDFAIFDYARFKKILKEVDQILYIGDNAGEIVFDRLLIENFKKKVTYVVRDKPIINDVTMDDAIFCRMNEVAKVISSGCDAPGIILKDCSDEFLDHYKKAGLIISKGQGNYETLSDVQKPIFFLLKAKCPVIARELKCKVGDIVLKRSI